MNLIRQIAKGNNEALEKLYNTYKTSVFRVALVILQESFLAEDAVQETFLKIRQNAGTFRYGANEKGWVLAIARNVAIDIYNRRKRELLLERPRDELGKNDSMDQSDDISHDGNEGFLQLIQPLNDLDKQIVSLYLIGELKHREIAQILEMNVGTVKKRYERAIKRIAQKMEKEGKNYGCEKDRSSLKEVDSGNA